MIGDEIVGWVEEQIDGRYALEPWQAEFLRHAFEPKPDRLDLVLNSHRLTTRRGSCVLAIAAAIRLGHPVKIAATTAVEADGLRREALELLDRLDQA